MKGGPWDAAEEHGAASLVSAKITGVGRQHRWNLGMSSPPKKDQRESKRKKDDLGKEKLSGRGANSPSSKSLRRLTGVLGSPDMVATWIQRATDIK